jgi:hypothetical protein
MAWEEFDYDPLTGARILFDYDEDTQTALIRKEEDVEGILKLAAELRATGWCDRLQARKEDWRHYAIIPTTVQLELHKQGLRPWSGRDEDARAVNAKIHRDYPLLKTTNMADG